MRHFIGGWALGWIVMFINTAINAVKTKKDQTVNGPTMMMYGLLFGSLVWGLWP